jgi:hypothetical protein
VIERAAQDPKVHKIVEDVRLFDGLHEHAGWRRLRDIVKENRERFMARFAGRLMAGQEVDPEEIAFHRGFYLGADWITAHPEEAIKTLEAAAERAYREVVLRSYTSEEEASPYA